MKLLLTLCFFLISFNAKIEIDNYDTDRTKKQEERHFRDDGTLEYQCFYREDGTKRKEKHFRADGQTVEYQFFYREDETMREAISYLADGKKYNSQFFWINEKEIKREERYFQADGQTLSYQGFFHEDGTLREERDFRADETLEKKTFYHKNGSKSEERYYQSDGKTLSYQFFYREDGTMRKAIIFQADGETLKKQRFYREDETLREARLFQADGKTPKEQCFYREDETLREERFFKDDGTIEIKLFYNKKIIEIKLYDQIQQPFFTTTDQEIITVIKEYILIDKKNNFTSFFLFKIIVQSIQTKKNELIKTIKEFNQALANKQLEAFLQKNNLTIYKKINELLDQQQEEILTLKKTLNQAKQQKNILMSIILLFSLISFFAYLRKNKQFIFHDKKKD